VVVAFKSGSSAAFFTRPSSKMAELTMKFETMTGNQRSRRSKSNLQAPAVVESLEVRSLMTVLSPTGTVNDATPTITWEAVDNAVSYDLWVTDAEQREVQFIKNGITSTNYTHPTPLNLGRTRAWVRPNFTGGVTGTWSTVAEFIVQVKPTVTGPINSQLTSTPNKLNETKPTITWDTPPGASRFEIFLSNQTELKSEIIRVANNTPILDADGNTQPDGNGDVLRQEVRSHTLTNDLPMGNYRVFVRSLDDGGRTSEWSSAFDFEVAPLVTISRPVGGTFQSSHVIEVNISGTPTAGSYSIAITTFGAAGRTLRTPMLPYNATAIQVQAAVRSLRGFETTEVATIGSSPNFTHRLQLPVSVGKVTASVTETVSPGTVSASVINAPGILLEWEPVEGATHYEVWVSKAGAVNEKTAIYSARYLTTTFYQIPALLADGNYVFWVRARRLHQVTEIKLTGTPTSGSYRIVLTTFGKEGTTQQTGPISYDATAAGIKAAVFSLKGFENADVVGSTNALNQTYLLQIPQTSGQVRVSVVGSINPGTLTHATRYLPEVVGLWSLRSDFSTIPLPVVTGPVGIESNDPNNRIVTALRPIIEWTPIDKAARYEVWVERSDGKTPYLRTTSSTNFYQFEQNIEPGKYSVWIRAVSTTGKMTSWSLPYSFTATGGVPVITSPKAGDNVIPIPDITWTPVTGAKSYNIQIAWLGVDFTYIQSVGISITEFAPTDPLPTGSYRVWVQAVNADGTKLPWSAPVNFSVALNEAELPSGEIPELLAVLLPTTEDAQTEVVAESQAQGKFDAANYDSPPDITAVPAASVAMLPMEALNLPNKPFAEEFLEQLASESGAAEWWMLQNTES